MKNYWKNIRRDCAGHYHAEGQSPLDTLHIFRNDAGNWSFFAHKDGQFPERGGFRTLAECKAYFGL